MRISVLVLLIIISVQNIGLSQNGWSHRNLGTGNLVSINFVNGSTGFIFRSDKWLFKTTDKGLMWDSSFINFPLPVVINGQFYNENIGGIIPPYITTDGGNTWIQSNLPTIGGGSLSLKKIEWANDEVAYTCGYNFATGPTGIIHKTTNRGLNWFISYAGDFDFEDVYFPNPDTGFICRGSVLRTINSGLSWSYLSGTSRHRYEFSEIFNDTLYLSSSDGFVAKTVNGGFNWTDYFTGILDTLIDITFLDNQTGYAIGNLGGIVKTTNGGINWTIQNSGTIRKLNEIWFLNKDTGFIAGDSGLLLVTYNGGVTSLEINSNSIPKDFILYQNYPNPFNPETKIKFEIPKQVRDKNISLSVFGISGKEIAVLVNGKLNPGIYEYTFDSEGLSSGVYFYKLESGEYEITKRMVLLK